MKYNKRELMAIEALNTLSTNLLSGRKTTLRSAEITAMHEVLGIVFHCSTAKAAKQKTFVRNKDDLLLSSTFHNSTNKCEQYYYFPFQFKK